MDRIKLRQAGDFPNDRVVEFATVKVELKHQYLPRGLQSEYYENDDLVAGLYETPSGRLTYKILYLDSVALADAFIQRLHQIFRSRDYAEHYVLKRDVLTTTQTVTATRGREKHSKQVEAFLAEE